MKKISLIIAFALLSATASFAKSGISKPTIKTKAVAAAETSTCTVYITVGRKRVGATITCECSQTQACDAAYAIAKLAIM